MLRSRTRKRLIAAACVVLVGGVSAGSSGSPESPDGILSGDKTARLRGIEFFVDPHTDAHDQAMAWESAGRGGDAKLIRSIADRPVATWLTYQTDTVEGQVRDVVNRAWAAGQMPVVVAYNVPHRDCGGYSTGGSASDAYYREWITAIARGIGDRPVTVILEPDAVAHTLDGCMTQGVQSRLDLLRWSITTLKERRSTLLYLDAGNPRWIADLGLLAANLRKAGIDEADGFSLNVSNFISTQDNIEYGTRLSRELAGATFVIDTSRNGNGPYEGSSVNGAPTWCNPPGRALGKPPTTIDTGSNLVDALLWIKVPGESDGACRPGEPNVGAWWPEYALGLARNAHS
jgi:endoglucanase